MSVNNFHDVIVCLRCGAADAAASVIDFVAFLT